MKITKNINIVYSFCILNSYRIAGVKFNLLLTKMIIFHANDCCWTKLLLQSAIEKKISCDIFWHFNYNPPPFDIQWQWCNSRPLLTLYRMTQNTWKVACGSLKTISKIVHFFSQFHQHFMTSFCAYFISKKVNLNFSIEKLLVWFSFKKLLKNVGEIIAYDKWVSWIQSELQCVSEI